MAFGVLKAWDALNGKLQNVKSHVNALYVQDQYHARVHEGIVYKHAEIHSLGNGGVHQLLLDCRSASNVNLRTFNYNVTNGPCKVYFWENSSVSAFGSEVNVINLHRDYSDDANMKVFEGFTIADTGTFVDEAIIESAGGGSVKAAGGDNDSDVIEWHLSLGSLYIIQLVNESGGAIQFGEHVVWYELEEG